MLDRLRFSYAPKGLVGMARGVFFRHGSTVDRVVYHVIPKERDFLPHREEAK